MSIRTNPPPASPGRCARTSGLARRSASGFKGVLSRLGLRAGFHFGLPAPFTRPELAQVQRLVFVCLANLNRSALAQALCEQAGVPAASFGLYTLTGGRTFSASMRMAADMGCRLERHRATHWKDFERRPGDLYLVMEPEQAEALVRLGIAPRHVALLGHWARPRRLRIRDPYLKSERELRRCFEQVRTAVAQLVAELRAGQRAPCHAAGQGRCAAAADGVGGAEAEPPAAWPPCAPAPGGAQFTSTASVH